jgi:hypothetical protein
LRRRSQRKATDSQYSSEATLALSGALAALTATRIVVAIPPTDQPNDALGEMDIVKLEHKYVKLDVRQDCGTVYELCETLRNALKAKAEAIRHRKNLPVALLHLLLTVQTIPRAEAHLDRCALYQL